MPYNSDFCIRHNYLRWHHQSSLPYALRVSSIRGYILWVNQPALLSDCCLVITGAVQSAVYGNLLFLFCANNVRETVINGTASRFPNKIRLVYPSNHLFHPKTCPKSWRVYTHHLSDMSNGRSSSLHSKAQVEQVSLSVLFVNRPPVITIWSLVDLGLPIQLSPASKSPRF